MAEPRFVRLWQRARIAAYRRAWDCETVEGAPELVSPALLSGAGRVTFHGHVILGWRQSPQFLSGYTYIEARYAHSFVEIGHETHSNNGVSIISAGEGITLGARCFLGPGVHIYDSDFHALDPALRRTDQPATGPVTIRDNVFLGTDAVILKGVTVGDGAVVAAGAVVASDVEPATVVAGNPASLVRRFA